MVKLYIDTRDRGRIEVCLAKDSKKYCEQEVANKLQAQTTLPIIEKLLRKTKTEISEIDEIKVEKDKGSYTGLRVGISIANALSFARHIKINGKKLGEIETANY